MRSDAVTAEDCRTADEMSGTKASHENMPAEVRLFKLAVDGQWLADLGRREFTSAKLGW